jgi:DNA-binding transcriptional LysR family regulator
MQKTNILLERLDIRSLRTLKVLLDTRSVTQAGEAMAISQPAASRVLAQLRHAIGDPLLVRGRHGNTLTPRGESLRPAVAEALEAISSLFEQEVFEASNTRLVVRVAATDHGATVVLAPLVQALATLAPGMTVEVAPWGDQTFSDLETGRLDLALDVESPLPQNFHFRTLFQETYVGLVRRGHPLLKALRKDGSLIPRLASAYPQIVLLYPVGNRLEGYDVLARLGYPAKRIALKTPYFTSAPLLLANTDNLIFLPERLGQTLARSFPLSLIPLRADTAFGYRLIWHERTQKDAALGWLRDQIYGLVQ